jgi:hypothetical protein
MRVGLLVRWTAAELGKTRADLEIDEKEEDALLGG